jgi:L-idonate 5-dehydrogenase
MQIGVVSGKMNIDIQTLFLKEACIKTSFRYKNTYEKCISLISNGLIDPMKLVSHTFGYKDYEEAFKVATTKLENPMKVIIKMN